MVQLLAVVGADRQRFSPLVEVVETRQRSPAETYLMSQNRDYSAALDACASSGSDYVLSLEDDAVSTRGVFDKIADAVRQADRKSSNSWGVLKLFVTEYWRGHWLPDWTTARLLGVAPLLLALAMVSVGLATFGPTSCKGRIRFSVALLVSLGGLFCFSALALGKANLVSLFPQGASRHVPPDALCASAVANLFPGRVVPGLAAYLNDATEPTDVAQCTYFTSGSANITTLGSSNAGHEADGGSSAAAGGSVGVDAAQWLFVPSLFQHVGRTSSNPVKGDMSCVWSKFAMTWREA
eukprot:TRINITY_DN17860_c0_g1_i1.p1 TRINITY_DN17860_c0_g1~~TRINITY_DN17860_c0_g1_i1.p1  ORF type:complete len:295 (+),score=59.19 TRINITY_DN17860_c0_g1_i1:688-1572(+)